MKPSEGKRMDSAMLPSRFSRSACARLGVCGSERTAVPGACLAAVALLLGARQRGSELGVGGAVEGRSGVPAPAARGRPRTVAARASCGFRPVVDRGGLLAVLRDCCRSLGRCSRPTRLGRWRSYGSIRPVLKHGARSLTCARVFG